MKKSKGITLVALVITVIIILIISGVSLSAINGNQSQSLFKKANIAKEQTNKKSAEEGLSLLLINIKLQVISDENRDTTVRDCDKLEGKKDVENIEYINEDDEEYALITYGKYVFKVNKELEIIDQNSTAVETYNIGNNDSLLGKVTNITESGIQNIETNGKTYTANVINYNGNLELDGKKQVEGAVLNNNIYEFGNNETDVATATTEAQNMVILKVNGNLIINEGVTLTACKSDEGYGGPKGMMIYCTGIITNNGTISMTARGAKAKGEDVYLWKNEDGNYEYIPTTGGEGAPGASTSGTTWNPSGWYYGQTEGIDAPSPSGRALAGGGSGAVRVSGKFSINSANGSNATSYSGGPGSGGAFSSNQAAKGYGPSPDCGQGGNAYAKESSGYNSYAAGGAGNPGGLGYGSKGSLNDIRYSASDGENGTRRTINNFC